MFKKILVPLDGSLLAEKALEHVSVLAAGCSVSEVVLLTVIEPFQGQTPHVSDDWLRKIQKEARITAEKYLTGLVEKFKAEGIESISVVSEGLPADVILDYAGKNKVDLIVISSHGRTGISRLVMGSVTDRVVRHATIPVLIVTHPNGKMG